MERKYKDVYEEGAGRLADAGISEASLDARLLLEFVCQTDRNTLLAHPDRIVPEEAYERYAGLIGKRAGRIPLQHLTGEQEFMGLTFLVNSNVLIPRQDTEILVEEVLKNLHDGMRILDMCTGSGCILLSLLQYSNECAGVGADKSGEALALAQTNYGRLRKNRPEMEAVFVQGDLFEVLTAKQCVARQPEPAWNVPDKFDIIVSNPPYIKTDVIESLMPEVREHEPLMALDGGADGLFFYREIAGQAASYLRPGGMLFFEIGCDQAADVRGVMEHAGFSEVKVVKDFAGLDRVVWGEMTAV